MATDWISTGRRVLRLSGLTDPFHRVKWETTSLGSNESWYEVMTYKYSPDFTTRDIDIPMLRVCPESRAVVFRAYPFYLPSIDGKSAIRFNHDDIIAIKDVCDLAQGLRTVSPPIPHQLLKSCSSLMKNKQAVNRNFPIPSGISQIKNLGFYACEPHIPYHFTDQHNNMFGKLTTMDHESLEVVLSIFSGVKNFVLVSDATMQINRTGICEGFKMGERACDMHDSVAQAMLAMEASHAKKLFQRTIATFSPSFVVQTPEVFIMARADKVDYEKECLQDDKKKKKRKKKEMKKEEKKEQKKEQKRIQQGSQQEQQKMEQKKKTNLIMRGGRRLVAMVKKLRKSGL